MALAAPCNGKPLRISKANMTDAEWREWRRASGIGASEIATVAGLNPYQTPQALHYVKTGVIPAEELSDKAAVYWGNRLESIVAEEYEIRTGRRVRQCNFILRHPIHEFAFCNVDRLIQKDERGPGVLQCKTAGTWAATSEVWGPDGTDQTPESYLVQEQYEMGITSYRWAHLAVLIGGQDFRIYHFERDEEIIANLFRLASNFWAGVKSGTPPPPINMDDARMRWSKSVPITHTANRDLEEAALIVRERKTAIEQAEREVEEAKLKIAAAMQNADTLLSADGTPLAFWKSDKNGKRSFRLAKGV